jgi:hypothetical protein
MATKGKHVVLTTLNHKVAVTKGLAIMQKVNTSINFFGGPFMVVGDREGFETKSLGRSLLEF